MVPVSSSRETLGSNHIGLNPSGRRSFPVSCRCQDRSSKGVGFSCTELEGGVRRTYS